MGPDASAEMVRVLPRLTGWAVGQGRGSVVGGGVPIAQGALPRAMAGGTALRLPCSSIGTGRRRSWPAAYAGARPLFAPSHRCAMSRALRMSRWSGGADGVLCHGVSFQWACGTAGGTPSATRTLPSSSSTVTWGSGPPPTRGSTGDAGDLTCLMACCVAAFGWNTSYGLVDSQLDEATALHALRHLASVLGYPPSPRWHMVEVPRRLPDDLRDRAITARMATPREPELRRISQCRTWTAWLQAAGVVGETVPTARGTICTARDGHPCRALMELTIDDSLDTAGIGHEHLAGHDLGQLAAMGYSFHRCDDAQLCPAG